jgi:hypothetical protein
LHGNEALAVGCSRPGELGTGVIFGTPLPPLPSGRAALRAQKLDRIEKRLITREEFMQKISEERATYQKFINPPTQ